MSSVTIPPRRSAELSGSVIHAVAEAVQRLLEQGERYTTLGLQRIADESGIARSTLYRYFPDKSALLIAVSTLATDEQFSVTAAWMEKETSTRDELDNTFRTLIRSHRDHAPLVRAMNEVAGYDEDVAAFWRKRIEQGAANVSRFIANGQKSGVVNPSLDPGTTADLIVWGVERVATQHVTTQPADEDDELALRLAAAFWSTLGLDADWQR